MACVGTLGIATETLALGLRKEAIGLSGPVDWSEGDRRGVEMVFEQAVARVGLQSLERDLKRHLAAAICDGGGARGGEPRVQVEAERLVLGVE